MNIVDVLASKFNKIKDGGDIVSVTAEELNILCDKRQLNTLKLYRGLPKNFIRESNFLHSLSRIREIDTADSSEALYYTLDYLSLTNNALSTIWSNFDLEG